MRKRLIPSTVIVALVGLSVNAQQTEEFKRGDANSDNFVSLADASYITNWLFLGGPAPSCIDSADANDDGLVTGADASYIAAWFSLGGPPPPDPGPFVCGEDPTEDNLDCEEGCP